MESDDTDSSTMVHLALSIYGASAKLAQMVDVLGRQAGVTGPQWKILSVIGVLSGGQGVSVKEIASQLTIDPSFVSAQTKQLQAEGLLHRMHSEQDGRVVILSLTEEARHRMETARRNRDRATSFIRNEIGDETVCALSSSLHALQKQLGRALLIAEFGEDLKRK